MARLLNIVVLLLEARGLYLSISERKWKILIFYTQLSNLVTALSAVSLLIAPSAPAVIALRYLSTCMLVMTFLVRNSSRSSSKVISDSSFPIYFNSPNAD